MRRALYRHLRARGCEVRLVRGERLHELSEGIESPRRQGLLDEAFDRERLKGFRFEGPEGLAAVGSLIVVAVPQPFVGFTFTYRGSNVELLVPPTYLHWRATDQMVSDVVADILAPAGYRVVAVNLPKKLLAAQAGLATYGRNNVTYVPGMGSYHRLVALASDAPCVDDQWQQPALLERCTDCSTCLRLCPTAAVDPERFLLRAERCISYHNEQPAEVPFPPWIEPSWHNCIVGCLLCQRTCPQNSQYPPRMIRGAGFSEEETELLLAGRSLEALPASLVEKLARSDLADTLDVLPRNLRTLLDQTTV